MDRWRHRGRGLALARALASSSPPAALRHHSSWHPNTDHRPPGPPAAERVREQEAEKLLASARACLARNDFTAAQNALVHLRRDYADTRFVPAHAQDLAALDAQIDAYVHGAAKPTTAVASERPPDDERWTAWEDLFDGKTLNGWRIAEGAAFARHGPVGVERGSIILGGGESATCIVWSGSFPREDYEVAFETMRAAPTGDFGTTLCPVGSSSCLLAVAAYGGKAGLSWVDGKSCDDNVTTRHVALDGARWYAVRLRVTAAKIEAWIDQEQVVDFVREGHTLTAPPDFTTLGAFSLGSLRCTSALRNIRLRRLEPEPPPDDERWGLWVSLFDGKALGDWRVVTHPKSQGTVEVSPADGAITLTANKSNAWVQWSGECPTMDYELSLEARYEPVGFIAWEIVVPIGSSHGRFVGYAGAGTSLESVDGGGEVKESPTFRPMLPKAGQWNRLRVRVTQAQMQCWVNDDQVVDLPMAKHTFSLRQDRNPLTPLGLATPSGIVSYRNIRLRRPKPEAAALPPPDAEGWISLSDGKTLDGWRVLEGEGYGAVRVENGRLMLEQGSNPTAVVRDGALPTTNYELALDVMRAGDHAIVVFPVGETTCTLWLGMRQGKAVAGLGHVDGKHPYENDTTRTIEFESDRWYAARVRVTDERIEAWLDDKRITELAIKGHTLLASAPGAPAPFRLFTWHSAAAFRSIRLRRLKPDAAHAPTPKPG